MGDPDAEGIGAALAGGRGSTTWRHRVVERSLNDAAQRSIARSGELVFAAATLLERANGDDFTVQEVADVAKQSVRAVYVHFGGKDDLLLAVFEEAMEAYARLLDDAIDAYQDPLERVAAAVYFATRFSERASGGVAIGISKVRARFAITMPDELARAQTPVTNVFLRVLREATEAGVVELRNPEAATFIIRSLVDSVGVCRTLGNPYGLDIPSSLDLVEFSLHGLGVRPPDDWQARFEKHWNDMPSTFSVAQDLLVATRGGNGRPGRP